MLKSQCIYYSFMEVLKSGSISLSALFFVKIILVIIGPSQQYINTRIILPVFFFLKDH